MDKLITEILEISRTKEGKTSLELVVKCMEELGEVAQALLSYQGASGCAHKGKTLDDVKEEAIDVILVIFALTARLGMDEEEIKSIIKTKIVKWQNVTALTASH